MNNKLKSSLVVLAFGLGMGMSNGVIAGYNPTPAQCAQLEEACEEDFSACRQWHAVAMYCQGIMN